MENSWLQLEKITQLQIHSLFLEKCSRSSDLCKKDDVWCRGGRKTRAFAVYFFGKSEVKMLKHSPHTQSEGMEWIVEEFKAKPRDMYERVVENFRYRHH